MERQAAPATSASTTAVAPVADVPPSMVERMTLILDTFDRRSSRLTLEDVARATSLPRSTAHRILDQLVKLRWLDHSPSGYALGQRALHLGGDDNGRGELRWAAAPLLHGLMLKTGLTVHLAVLDEGRVHYVDKVGGRFATSVPSRVGGHAPATSTALGKAMLAWLPAETVDAMMGGSPADLQPLHQELNRVRSRNGLAFERGECFSDIACVAAAVRGPEGPVAAISLVGDPTVPLERVAPLVLHAAQRVSRELFPCRAPRGGARRTPSSVRQVAS